MKNLIGVYVSLFFITCILYLINACSSKPGPKIIDERVKISNDLVKYSIELDQCKELGKDAGKYSVYEECANKVDIKYGKK